MERKIVDARVRANARLLDAGRYTIEDVVPENSRVDVYVYAIAAYDYQLDNVDERYIDLVKAELNIN